MYRPSIMVHAAVVYAAVVLLVSAPWALAGGQKGEGHRRNAHAAPDPSLSTPIDEFERMSPQEQQQALARLPAAQRQSIEQRLRKFNQLPPDQRQTLRNLYSRLHQLPPRQQEAVRKAIDRFSKQPPDRQQAIRDQLRSLAALPEPERGAHLTSDDFRRDLGRKEQGIVRDMLPLLPWN
jgi:hypothetical protein